MLSILRLDILICESSYPPFTGGNCLGYCGPYVTVFRWPFGFSIIPPLLLNGPPLSLNGNAPSMRFGLEKNCPSGGFVLGVLSNLCGTAMESDDPPLRKFDSDFAADGTGSLVLRGFGFSTRLRMSSGLLFTKTPGGSVLDEILESSRSPDTDIETEIPLLPCPFA